MKKILSVVLVLCLMLTALPLGVFTIPASAAATTGATGDCTWSLDGTVLTISGNGNMEEYQGISAPWGTEITEVVIENGVIRIGGWAFYNCESLQKVTISSSVTWIGYSAFCNCKSLENITIPNGVTMLDNYAFSGCHSLKNIIIPGSILTLGESTFSYCDSLESIVLEDGVKYINSGSIAFCKNLKKLTIPKSVKEIGSIATGCDKLVVYYRGSEADKYCITINAFNHILETTWHYNSCIGSVDHIYDNNCDAGCNACGDIRKITHDYADATCKAPKTCKDCGATEGEALGHSSDAGTVTKQPTCTEEGVKTYTCTVCGEVTGTEVVPVLPHDYADATCKAPKTCKDCGATEGEALGHSSDAGTVTKQPTCTEEGVKTYTCTVCGEVNGTEVVPAIPHDYADATCTAPKICTVCGATKGEKLDHTYDNDTDADCNVCGYVREVQQDGWVLDGANWVYYAGGEKAVGWKYIGASWYYFNDSGVMQTGWLNLGGTWYYLAEGGAMVTGWLNLNGTWYYLSEGGAMVTGWLNLNGTWYYLSEGGSMATGWQYIGSSWYYFTDGGSMMTGWLNLGGTWYYLSDSGNMVTDWQYIGNSWYYFHSGGNMATGWLLLGNTWYYLADGGNMLTGWHLIGGTWYLFNQSGAWIG